MNILGISCFYHDSASSIVKDGELLAACQEERFTRKKHDESFPLNSIRYCLDYAGLEIDDIDIVIYYEKPFLKFERLLETYLTFSPRGFKSFITSVPVWLRQKLYIKKTIKDELGTLSKNRLKFRLLFSEHHLSHASSAFFPSPFKNSAILTVDGVGEWATTVIAYGEDEKITILKELHFPHSIGLLFTAFTYFLGFRVNSGEYKLMGLAPYGNPDAEETQSFIHKIKNELIDIKDDGSILLDQSYFNYATGLKMIHIKKWEALFNCKIRDPEGEFKQGHCNLAYAIQAVTEEILIKLAREAKRLTASDNVCLAGGVALNCVANSKILKLKIFENIYIQPASGDAGGAVGAALAAHYIFNKNPRNLLNTADIMKGTYLGPDYSDSDIEKLIRKYNSKARKFESFDDLIDQVTSHLVSGNTIGWFQGRMEFGPRALGNRSIIADPSNPEMQSELNLKIKYRESFRPFAASVLEEDKNEYFDISCNSPYMLLVSEINRDRKYKLPDNYKDLTIKEKLYHKRSQLNSITHVDYTCRLHTVNKSANEKYWKLINKFKEKTSLGLLINTSFNVRGEPIVCSPEDAYRCFLNTELDILVLENYLFLKSDQNIPDSKEVDKWKNSFILD